MNTPSTSPTSSSLSAADTPDAGSVTTLRQPLTKEQRDAFFAKTAATMQPARSPSGTELLAWKPQILEYYAKGFSATQLRDILRASGVATSERVIQRFIAKQLRERRRRSASAKRALSNRISAKLATPSDVDEPSTGRRSSVSSASRARQPAANN